jgi:hypothetical protein
MSPVGSVPWTSGEDKRLRTLALSGIKCRGTGNADEAQHGRLRTASQTKFDPASSSWVEGEGEMARLRFVSLSPPNKRSLCHGPPR